MDYTDKTFWDNYFVDHPLREVNKVVFSDVFPRFLKPDPTKTILEVGCAGGDFLCYLAKTFQYQAFGVDYSDAIDHTRKLFASNHLSEPTLYQNDFFTWQPNRTFDVVCSFGFVEHFDDLKGVIARHADLVAPGGKLIITLPHFAHLQYFFHWLVDHDNLKKHQTKSMRLHAIRSALTDQPFIIDHLSYYRTFGFWTERASFKPWERVIYESIQFAGKVLVKLIGLQRPNFLVSPHIICVATRQPTPPQSPAAST